MSNRYKNCEQNCWVCLVSVTNYDDAFTPYGATVIEFYDFYGLGSEHHYLYTIARCYVRY